MALALEIEFLNGTSYAALGPDSDAPDWPPQADRVFSALVATWAAHGQPDDERQALEWLEGLPVPKCLASEGSARNAPQAFVPPNDPSVQRAKLAAQVLPATRKRKERRFPALRPYDPVVRHYWQAEPDDATLAALQRLARDTAYVGHSSSLTRCHFTREEPTADMPLRWPQKRIYPGRLKELCLAYARFERSADRKDRPAPGAPFIPQAPNTAPKGTAFASRWLVLEHVDGVMPDLRAAALVARGIRLALMSGYGKLSRKLPFEVSGHELDGSPALGPHMAVVPLAFTGYPHADGRVLGFALVPPAGSGLLEDTDFLRVLRDMARPDETRERRLMDVRSVLGTRPAQAFALKFTPVLEVQRGRASLDPGSYCGTALSFATVTPIALDRHPRSRGAARQDEIAALVASACLRIGLPEPESVRVDKHAALEGVPSAYPSGASPEWMGWRLPASLSGRPLTHAVLRFRKPVSGPLLLGAGRFVGLGFCRPLDGEDFRC